MSSDDSPKTRQQNEFEVLKSIYGDQLKDLRTKLAWNTWAPLNLAVTLTPQQGSSSNAEIYVQVDLHIKCSEKYPNCAPEIILEHGKGVPDMILIKLQEDLQKKAEQYNGKEMIYDLCQQVSEFLYRHNKPAMKSFYDEMLIQEQQKKIKDEQQKQLERYRDKVNFMMEVQKRQEMIKFEAKLQKERQRSLSENENEPEFYRRSSVSKKALNNFECNDESNCEHNGSVLIDFSGKEVQRGQCIRHVLPNNVIFTGLDKNSGKMMVISEWNLECKQNESAQVLKHLTGIEQEFNYLTKLHHPNLSRYLGFKQEVMDNKVVVYVLQEFIYGISCNSLFSSTKITVEMESLKHIARGILSAIEYLHRKNIIHKDLHDACVFISDTGTIKVSNYSIHKRLTDIPSSVHGFSKKADIYDFGKLMLRLLGQNAEDDNVIIPTNIQSHFYDLLTKCLEKNEKLRHTAVQLLNHPFFNNTMVHFTTQQLELPIERNNSPEIVHNLSSTSIGNGQSRINNEFEIMEHLGKGAYGDVLKAKNKLDGIYYAIKKIKLNPKNKFLKKKIVGEVLLLSRLNHENVVRYFNSWIETTTITGDPEESSSATPSEPRRKVINTPVKEETNVDLDLEKLAPPWNVEISISYDSKYQPPYDESSDEESSDEDDAFDSTPVRLSPDSDSIVFETERTTESSSKTSPSTTIDKSTSTPTKDTTPDIVLQEDCLYIQMEFCEKSTLRTAIDDNLYKDQVRVWRLFREIVEGLAYIHQQRVIHRDLKPVNIFLDFSDHVKIGDFGLATTIAIRSKLDMSITKSEAESIKEEIVDESKTGQIGTALYVAPEIDAVKAIYNQKVDIYSLGIILFEMCYNPLNTGMERIKILNKLRSEEIIFPDDFNNERANHLIRWLLNHDISKRPTCEELLQSEHLPPPVLEERELQELIRRTLQNPQLKGYRYLISSCFKQTLSTAEDITYDKDSSAPANLKPYLYDFVRESCIKIFKQHGGHNLATPLLMPKSHYYDNVETYVKLMTHSGNVVSLPHDLRVPFARYIAWNGINLFRRYSVERVYREKKIFGFLPRELYECAFDIISPSKGNLMPDAEILYIVYEIIKELPGLRNKQFLVKLNHTVLLKAILLNCGLKDKHEELIQLISDVKEGKIPKAQMQSFLTERGLSDSMIHTLNNFLFTEIESTKASNHFQSITRKSSDPSEMAKMALQELQMIIRHAEAYGVDFNFVIAPALVYNFRQYSGMISQFCCELKKKKHENREVVAMGGRYDTMINYYRSIMEHTTITKEISQAGVGISISLDKLVQAVQKQAAADIPKTGNLDAIVCSLGTSQLIKEKIRLLKYLWSNGIRAALLEDTNSVEVQDQLIKLGVPTALILKDADLVRVKTWEVSSREGYDRFQEKQYTINELHENLPKIFKIRAEGVVESTQTSTFLSRSESKSSYSERNDWEPDIRLITTDKLTSNAKRKYDVQIRSQLDDLFKKLVGPITAVGVTADSKIVRTLSAFLVFNSESLFWESVEDCISRHPKHKKHISEICEELWNIKTSKTNPTIVIHSLPENFYKLLI